METLQHTSHNHALNLRQFSEDCTGMKCSGCNEEIHGSAAYCCEECKAFLHKSCAELPSNIQHPFDQQHRLEMLTRSSGHCDACEEELFSIGFQCNECQTCFCTSCIAATIHNEDSHTTPVDDLTAHHLTHEHPLRSSHIGTQSKIKCKVCMIEISGEVYACYDCVFFLHKNCAGFLREVKHPFHLKHPLNLLFNLSRNLKCDACGNRCCSLAYSCSQCQFYLDLNCAVATIEFEVTKDSGLFIDHITHQHRLKSFHVKMNSRIPCKLCQENISGEVYGCTDCTFFLHKSCMQLPPKIEHPLHGRNSLALVPISPADYDKIYCSSCEENISSYTFAFICEDHAPAFNSLECKFVLDVKCALETLTCVDQGGLVEIKHDFLGRKLRLCYWKRKTYWCSACERIVRGLAYKSPKRECMACKADQAGQNFDEAYYDGYLPSHTCSEMDIFLHKSCAVELPLVMRHPYHAQHALTLRRKQSYECDGCLESHVEDAALNCAECYFDLDFPCVSRNSTFFKHFLHEHSLSHFVEIKRCTQCEACDKSCCVDVYRCVPCTFNIHVDCLPQLPPKVKHRHHFHQLTLADTFVEDDYGEYICEFCGKDRNLELGAYYCEECPRESTLVAHIECAVSGDAVLADKVRQIVKVKEKRRAAAILDRRIAPLQAKVNALEKELAELSEELEALKIERATLE